VDRDFVQAASVSSSTEIDAAKLATSNSSDKDVKSFAHHMMLDHTKLTVQLKMAAPHGVEVPKDHSDSSILDALELSKARNSIRPTPGKSVLKAIRTLSRRSKRRSPTVRMLT
jgi:predicted outer membrane protein